MNCNTGTMRTLGIEQERAIFSAKTEPISSSFQIFYDQGQNEKERNDVEDSALKTCSPLSGYTSYHRRVKISGLCVCTNPPLYF